MWSAALKKAAASLIDMVYPPVCAGCGREYADGDRLVCAGCRETAARPAEPVCGLCGAPGEPDGKGPPCRNCPRGEVFFEKARAVFDYGDERARNLVRALKFKYRTRLAVPMAGMMAERFPALFSGHRFDAVAPVPLHKKRLREREFNQAELLARPLAEREGIPLKTDWVARIRKTKPQTRLAPGRRRENPTGAFRAAKPDEIAGKRILLIDDVMTTGCTANECARALRDGGAESVCVFTFARAVLTVGANPRPDRA